jgi:malonate transporter MadM subunit
MEQLTDILVKDGLLVALIVTAVVLSLSTWISTRLTGKRIPGPAIAITAGLVLAYVGGTYTDGSHGIADIGLFSGFALLGGNLLRDFTIVATAMGARFDEMRKAGWSGVVSLLVGVCATFLIGASLAWTMGYSDAKSMTTLGAGACTFIVGPVTGAAIGAPSEIIALSIAATSVTTLVTPWAARYIGLDNPQSAMVFGGLIGTTSGVAAGLAATDPKLVPYGAITATFYTGLGCLLCPSILYYLVQYFAGS